MMNETETCPTHSNDPLAKAVQTNRRLLKLAPQDCTCIAARKAVALTDGEREVLARAADCTTCEGTGQSLQGWTDKRGFSEDQYGPCPDCGRLVAAVEHILTGRLA